MTMQRTMKLYRLPEASGALGQWAGAREAEESLAQGHGFEGEGSWGQNSDPNHSSRFLDLPFLLFVLSSARVLF